MGEFFFLGTAAEDTRHTGAFLKTPSIVVVYFYSAACAIHVFPSKDLPSSSLPDPLPLPHSPLRGTASGHGARVLNGGHYKGD